MLSPKREELVVCVGGGHFGSKAAQIARNRGAHVIVIDRNPNCKAMELSDRVVVSHEVKVKDTRGATLMLADNAIDALIGILKTRTPDWIVPAIPGHTMGSLTKKWLTSKGLRVRGAGRLLREALKKLPKKLVVSVDENNSVIALSYMPKGMKCKADCQQPKICPVTMREKPLPMYKLLKSSLLEVVDCQKIFIAKQLGGVGGIVGSNLMKALKQLEILIPPYLMAIGTACECHGIVNLFAVDKRVL